MTYRTFNPWGHVSKANRLSRLRTQSMIWAHGQIMQKVENGSRLFEELQEIHNKEKEGAGISEETIETALG